MGKQTVDPIDFHSMETILSICIYFYSTWKKQNKTKTKCLGSAIEVNRVPSTFWLERKERNSCRFGTTWGWEFFFFWV